MIKKCYGVWGLKINVYKIVLVMVKARLELGVVDVMEVFSFI